MRKLNTPAQIFVGMSGGVDSSVAAFLLKEAGHQIAGVFMKNWEDDDTDSYCPAAQDLADAQAVCDLLKIELHSVNFAGEYWQNVFTHFLDEYHAGRTPNPDILCNKEIKFKAFLEYAKQCGKDYIATGHYAKIVANDYYLQLAKASDLNKDQSYFLHALNQDQLAQSLFPIGHLTKQEVRALAKKLGLKNHAKKDSTGICFIGERKFKAFLNEYLPAKPGVIETLAGEVIGKHDGLMFYTIGQRQGLCIGGKKGKAELPWYVVQKDITRNTLIVVQGEHESLFKTTLIAHSLHWIYPCQKIPATLHAKTRYRQKDQACAVELITDDSCRVIFNQPQRAITPGQAIVFYHDDICLGGGIIGI